MCFSIHFTDQLTNFWAIIKQKRASLCDRNDCKQTLSLILNFKCIMIKMQAIVALL
jgi:hypothetical protein